MRWHQVVVVGGCSGVSLESHVTSLLALLKVKLKDHIGLCCSFKMSLEKITLQEPSNTCK